MAAAAYQELYLAAASPLVRAVISPCEPITHHETGVPTLMFKASLAFDDTDLAGAPEGGVFLRGLREWGEVWQQAAEVEVLIWLPESYPAEPPEVRMLRPVLVAGTGGVQNGFFLRLPELFTRGWVPSTPLADVIGWLRGCLLGCGTLAPSPAEVRAETNAFYTLDAYSATRRRVLSPPMDPSIMHRSGFQHNYTIVSSHFAQYAMYASVPPGFEAGGKALLPMHALELLMRSELQEGLDAAPSSANFLGINLDAATAEGTPRGDALNTLLVGQDDAMTSESAMLFAASSVLNFPVFLGCREFTSPEPGVIIVPSEVLANMGVAEGSVVTLARVDLPQITSVVLQPHSADFLEVESVTGLPPREFLEQSFGKFSCLAPGETIVVDGDIPGGKEYRFSVVAVEPRSAVFPAGALFQGFASQISIEFLPAVDTVVVVPDSPRGPEVGTFLGYGEQDGAGAGAGAGAGGGAGAGEGAGIPLDYPALASASSGSSEPAGAGPQQRPSVQIPAAEAPPAAFAGQGRRLGGAQSGSGGAGSGSSSGGASVGGGGSSVGGGISSRNLTFDPAAAAHLSAPAVSPSSSARAAPPPGVVSIEERRRRAAEAAAKRMGL